MGHRHVVMFSGGVGSWAAAKRVVAAHGVADTVLLFADTNMEDADLYRFVDEAAENVGVPLTRIADGRTPWEVFVDVKMIGNNRFDPCSKILKRVLLDKWLTENCDPSSTTTYVGIDWTEKHRFNGRPGKPGLRDRMAERGWTYAAPLCDRPLLSKDAMLCWLQSEGVEPPQLYKLGFPHNNCGGACVKAGHAQWAHLLKVMPERFAWHEEREIEAMNLIGTKWTVLKDRRGGITKPLTLREFRRRIESNEYSPRELEGFEWGGCACAIELAEEAA